MKDQIYVTDELIDTEAIRAERKAYIRKEITRKTILAILWTLAGYFSLVFVGGITSMIINCFIL